MDDDAYIAGVEVGIDMGRREVINWLATQGGVEEFYEGFIEVSLVTLKLKLDEWGIKEEALG